MLKLKPVEAIDEQRLFEWRNLPEIIERGFRSRTVSKEEHANWFAEALKGELRRLWIIIWNGEPIGQLRFDLVDSDDAEISIYLVPTYMGRGIGVQAIREGCKMIRHQMPDIRIVARVAMENKESLSAFRKAGFSEEVESKSNSPGLHIMIWKSFQTVPHNRLTFGEEEESAVVKVIRSGQWTAGAVVNRLEASFGIRAGDSHAVGVGSGLAALRLSLLALGIVPGDKVIVPAYSCVALANSVLACGGEPVAVDVEDGSWNISVDACASAIRSVSGIKAAIAVHTFGYPAPIREIQKLGIPVIEDCSHGFGISPLGSLGELAVVSLHATKLIGCGEGGMILTQDSHLAKRVKAARDYSDKPAVAWRLNDRMTDLSAAIAECQLARLPSIIFRRNELAARYNKLMETNAQKHGFSLPNSVEGRLWYRYSIHTDVSQPLIDRLHGKGIHAAIPVENWIKEIASFPVAMRAFNGNVSIPLYPSLTFVEQDAVISSLSSKLI